ncbi:MAG: restriction endonuclease [Acidobacteriaceae bacterium]
MSNSSRIINSPNPLYIKLGPSGSWEKECLEKGILRFGYNQTPLEAAVTGDWETVWKTWNNIRGDAGTATRDLAQIRHFFTAGDDRLWITFSGSLLWWCFAKPGAKMHEDGGGVFRECVNGWHCKDAKGKTLSMDQLSGSLLRVQGFRGTICEVKAFDYLKRKLNGEMLPVVEAAVQAENEMIEKIVPLMQHLTWQDFELLVDLVFSNSGWRRTGQVGKTQKTVDIELLLPTTNERAFVQVKSSTNQQDLADYSKRLEEAEHYHRMFFVWHSGDLNQVPDSGKANVKLIGPDALARMVFDAGLTRWLLEKVS